MLDTLDNLYKGGRFLSKVEAGIGTIAKIKAVTIYFTEDGKVGIISGQRALKEKALNDIMNCANSQNEIIHN